jgi:AraC-like DNA-binding protein
MTTRNGSTIGYTSYNLPNVIMAGSNSSKLCYGASRNRYKQVTVTSGVSETTIYVGGLLEKVGFQQLLDEVRSSMAIEYLQNTLMPVEEIGHRIGFTDASILRKAFRRWTGKPPSAYRRPGRAN